MYKLKRSITSRVEGTRHPKSEINIYFETNETSVTRPIFQKSLLVHCSCTVHVYRIYSNEHRGAYSRTALI